MGDGRKARSLTQMKAMLRERLPKPLRERLRQANISTHWLADMYRFNIAQSDARTLAGRARSAFRITRTVLDRKWVLFRPEVPAYEHAMYKICLQLGYRITGDRSRPFEAAISWEDTAFATRDNVLSQLSSRHAVVNLGCLDTSKTRVAMIFAEVFGYALIVDPRKHSGRCVQKSERNAQHDGKIIDCPTEPEAGFTYQKLINNEVHGGLVQDIRMPVIGHRFPFVYLKYRPINIRFRNLNASVELARVEDVLSHEEIEKARQFCRALSLDYGEVDMLRNKEDGQLYIVDVNTTPSGPPNHISIEGARTAVLEMANAFKEVLSSQSQPSGSR